MKVSVIPLDIDNETIEKSIMAYMIKNNFRPESVSQYHGVLENLEYNLDSILQAAGSAMLNEWFVKAIEAKVNETAIESMMNTYKTTIIDEVVKEDEPD